MILADTYQDGEPVTLEAYEALPESEGAWPEVHEGKLVWMGGTSGAHSTVLDEVLTDLINLMRAANRPCVVKSSTFEVKLASDPLTIYMPDLMIISDRKKLTNKRYEGAPPIVMEVVSPSSIYNDCFYKLAMYCKYGVREYWILDPLKNRISVYFFEESHYPEEYSFRDTVSSHVCPAIRIDFSLIRQVLLDEGNIPPDSEA